jgi:hypothetical protein
VVLSQRHLREEALATGEGGEVGGGHAGDLGEGFLREKGLVCGDEDVGESEQAREFVVLQDLAGEILEEEAFLFLIHVERNAAEAAWALSGGFLSKVGSWMHGARLHPPYALAVVADRTVGGEFAHARGVEDRPARPSVRVAPERAHAILRIDVGLVIG